MNDLLRCMEELCMGGKPRGYPKQLSQPKRKPKPSTQNMSGPSHE